MIRIFTQAFFRLPRSDQAAVVDSAIRDLNGAIGRHMDPRDDAITQRTIRRIEKKALEHGVHAEEATFTTTPGTTRTRIS